MSLLRRFYEEYGRIHGAGAVRSFDEVERALRAKGYLDRVLKAAWPSVAPDRLVHRLLTSRALLAEAADGILDDARAAAAPAARRRLVGRRRRAARRSADRARRAAARVRARDRRRGAGPDADAAADGRAPRARRRVHGARRRRAGDRPGSLLDVGRGAAAPAARRRSGASRSSVMPIACRARSWSSRCRCSTDIAPDVAPPIAYRTGAAPPVIRRVEEAHLLVDAFRRRCGGTGRPARR